ncbi:ArsR/SmtB family transcription factor [Thalassolituus sp. LLYu03]|uniref:ArsR/SmtB family transcription factor n=1 Tax=Thalassolituus sp. LLYu03 TaxID=3421656 RepID=UPI003D2BD790
MAHDTSIRQDALDSHRQQAVRLLKALANEHRLNILCCLRNGEVSVSELSNRLPLSQSALSQHLAWLRAEHLVHTRRSAQNVYYELSDDKAERIINVLNGLYCDCAHEAD